MGSGHFLVYAFDVLMLIYSECGYSERDAARSILENNLYGLDIDDRASQLAYFAVMMKARKHNRRILNGEVKSHIFAIPESNSISTSALEEMGKSLKEDDRSKAFIEIQELIADFHNAKEIGSIMQLRKYDWDLLRCFVMPKNEDGQMSLDFYDAQSTSEQLLKIINVAEVLTSKYPIITTNPPYLNKYSDGLKQYVAKYYKDYSGDLFSVFMYKCFDYCIKGGYTGFMTPYVWMFIQTYEKLRKYIIEFKGIESLIQMEYSAFSEATVPICAFVLINEKQKIGVYLRLSDFKGGMQVQGQKVREALGNEQCTYKYMANQNRFSAIPGSPIAYWMPEILMDSFAAKDDFGEYYECYVGMRTGDNARFLRLWQEVSSEQEILTDANVMGTYDKKWVPYLKGGDFRRWYYNYDYVVDWLNNGEAIKDNTRRVYPQLGENLSWKITNESQYFREGITFNAISSSAIGFKRFYSGAIFSNASHAIMHSDSHKLNAALAFLNSKVVKEILSITSPTINYTPSDIKKLPFKHIVDEDTISSIASKNVEISKQDWDSFETSWNFKRHPLI